MTVRFATVAACAGALLLGAPTLAPGHSIVRVTGSEVTSLSADATSLNTLTARLVAGRIELRDPTVDGGMDIGSCDPGEVDGTGYIVEAFCPAQGVTLLRIDAGDREDTVTAELAVPLLVLGGQGADVLRTGSAKDTVRGGDGDDRVTAGAGPDTVEGGAGVDSLDLGAGDDLALVRDGLPDTVRCGAGTDRVDADPLDDIAADCERVERIATAPPADEAPGTSRDRTPPRIEVGGSTVQRLGGSGVIRLAATSSEPGTIAASGSLDIAGLARPLLSPRERVSVAGGGVDLRIKLSRRQLTEVRRALGRGRRVKVRLGVVATDVAGNSAQARAPAIRLLR